MKRTKCTAKTIRMHKLAETLKALLKNHPQTGKQTSYKALGEAIGIQQQTISQYANGQTYPTSTVVLAIADYFGVTVDYLLTGEDDRERYESMYKCLSEREKEQVGKRFTDIALMCLEEAAKYVR